MAANMEAQMRMTRYWMTGCMALILLAAGRWPAREEIEETQVRQGARITLTSKYGLDETLRQIERSARQNGLPVVARTALQPPALADAPAMVGAAQQGVAKVGAQAVPKAAEHNGARGAVHVLGDEGGQTPMIHDDGAAAADLPWKLLIRQQPDGRTEVSFSDPRATALPDGVSVDLARRVMALPQLVRAAIT
jgi:uncharacterized protein (DUF302 family)